MIPVTFNLTILLDGVLSDADEAPTMVDESALFAVRRTDTSEVVLAASPTVVAERSSVGVYSYTFEDGESGVEYETYFRVLKTVDGVVQTSYVRRRKVARSLEFGSDDPAMCLCWQISRTAQGVVKPNSRYTFDLMTKPSNSTDNFSGRPLSATSNQSGYMSIELPRLSRFKYRLEGGEERAFLVPDAPSFKLPSVSDGE